MIQKINELVGRELILKQIPKELEEEGFVLKVNKSYEIIDYFNKNLVICDDLNMYCSIEYNNFDLKEILN